VAQGHDVDKRDLTATVEREVLDVRAMRGTVGAWRTWMIIIVPHRVSQDYDDARFFKRMTLIDICCGPPMAR